MPTYQYACTACGEPLEAVQSFTDPALTDCPLCAGRLRKVFSAVGVVFKGSGFYKNDSRPAAAAGSEGAAGDSKPDSNPDAKPDAKPDAAAAKKTDPATKGPAAAPSTGTPTTAKVPAAKTA